MGTAHDLALPPELLEAVSAPGGSKITIVVGAGCSFEAPTSIPLAATCALECHNRLVDNGVLDAGDCSTPTDLSCVADAVFRKHRSQKDLVTQLRENYDLKAATPNEGHDLAAALLGEGALTAVLTLNFDLSLTAAIAGLGVGERVGIIDGPSELLHQKTFNVYYLHGNANLADPEAWVLRTEALKSGWKATWRDVITRKALSAPVVVFAGLGSPAEVLIESAKLIQEAFPDDCKAFQVDPDDPSASEFFKALGLDRSAFIQMGWCDFMEALSQRLVKEHARHLRSAADGIVGREKLTPEDIDGLLRRLEDMGLCELGCLRASWLLHRKRYRCDESSEHGLIADLLLAAAMVERVGGVVAVPFKDGIVEFRRGNQVVAACVFVSGLGTYSPSAVEAELSAKRRTFRDRTTPPTGVVVCGTRSNAAKAVASPPDIIFGDVSQSILTGSGLKFFHVESLRQDPSQVMQVVQ